MAQGRFMVRSHTQIMTHVWLDQRILGLVGIPPLGCLRYQAITQPFKASKSRWMASWDQATINPSHVPQGARQVIKKGFNWLFTKSIFDKREPNTNWDSWATDPKNAWSCQHSSNDLPQVPSNKLNPAKQA